MVDTVKLVADSLLSETALSLHALEKVVGDSMARSVDYADLYLQSIQEESWILEDSIVKSGGYSVDRGFGLRVVSGEKLGFAYADNINRAALLKAVNSAKSIVHDNGIKIVRCPPSQSTSSLYVSSNPLESFNDREKIQFLHDIDRYAREINPLVRQVVVNLSGQFENMMVMNSDGVVAADMRPMVNLHFRVMVEKDGQRETASSGCGARAGYETLKSVAFGCVEKAVRQACQNLEAQPAPAGLMPVVLGPGWPAVLLHEAVGHGLEGDFNRKGSSAFSGRIGERVASSLCTIVDDGTLPGRTGSLTIDDEGTPTEKTVLIEDGILKNYMQDVHNARLMKTQSTGNGRRESYSELPMPRMTNTYMLPGNSEPMEIIQTVKNGLYAVDFAGGQVDITSGKFVFSANEAYLIENGKVTRPVKGATLIGNGPDVLTKVSMVGNDMELDAGIGVCGKSGQSVPVGVGQPTLKLDELTVGGTN